MSTTPAASAFSRTPGLAHRREEAGSQLQANREHEEAQSELLHEIDRGMVDGLAEVTDDEARENHPRGAEHVARDLQAAGRLAGDADDGDQADGGSENVVVGE